MPEAVVDTNVLIYDTFEDSDLHVEAKTSLDSLKKWIIPGMVIHEYVWFMQSENVEPSFTKDKILEYLTDKRSIYQGSSIDDVILAVDRMKTLREYNDLVILSVAKRLKAPLLTFDDDLKREAHRLGLETV